MGRTGVGTLCLWLCAVVCLAHGQHYVNVARDKTYNQSSKYQVHVSSSNAANGVTGGDYPSNCIHTAGNGDLNPWWEVDLGMTCPVYNITVWPRSGASDLAQRLYPSSITVDGQLCASISYTDKNEKNVTCPYVMYGQTVRITRHPPVATDLYDMTLSLCEMQIWGCVSGWYGDQCSTACSPGCQDTGCDRQSGHCSPCNVGYTGNRCSECEDTYYNTSSGTCVQCSANCLSQSCEDQTGKCNGCVSGWYGDQCSTACSPGCQDTSCDQQSGQCACTAEYAGDTCTECDDTYYNASSGTCVQCSANCQSQSCEDLTGKCNDCVDGYYKRSDNTGCDACRGTCQPGTVCDKTTGFCTLCPPDKHGDYCEQVKENTDETVNTSVIVGAVVGTGLFIGVCIIILAVVHWALRSRILSRQSRTTTDNPEVTAFPASVRPADRGKANAVFHGVTDEEEHYESVGDIPMTTKHAHPGTSTNPDTTTCVYPGTSTHPDTMSHVTEADNPYDLPAEQYSNTGEVHLYDPWRVSRAAQPDDDINMTAHTDGKGKVPGEKGNDYENPN